MYTRGNGASFMPERLFLHFVTWVERGRSPTRSVRLFSAPRHTQHQLWVFSLLGIFSTLKRPKRSLTEEVKKRKRGRKGGGICIYDSGVKVNLHSVVSVIAAYGETSDTHAVTQSQQSVFPPFSCRRLPCHISDVFKFCWTLFVYTKGTTTQNQMELCHVFADISEDVHSEAL